MIIIMNRILFLLISAFTFITYGCGDSACYKKLIEVDSLTENDLNDSANKIIQIIENTYNIKDGKERAYYSLLKYQLLFRKNRINKNVHVEDSLINYSISYYSDNEDARKLALSYYLKGRMSKEKDAIRYFKKAEFTVQKTDNNFLKMRIFNCIALANLKNEDYKTGLKFGLKSIKYGQKANDTETLIWCYLTVSDLYGYIHKPDSCIFFANKCIDYLDKVPLAQKASIYINVAAAIENTDTAKAKEYALKSLEIRKSNSAYQILAKLARDRKDYAQSEAYLEEALKYSPSVDWEAFILYELAQTKEHMGKYKEANIISKKVIELRDSVEHIHARDSIKEIQLAAELDNKKQSEMKAKDDYTAIIVVVLTTIIAITLAAYAIKRRKHKKSMDVIENMEKNMENMEKDIKTMEKHVDNAEKQMDKYRHNIKKLEEKNKEKEKEINAAGKETRKQLAKLKKETEKAKQKETELYQKGFDIYNKVKNGTKIQGWDNEKMKSIVTFYTTINTDFKKQTEQAYTGLTEYQYTILIMKDMGLNNKQIADALGTNDNAIRTMISRIKKRPASDKNA